MTFGITDTGFTPKSLQDIKSEIEEQQREYIPGIDQTADSVNGQQIGVYSKPGADVWEQVETLYYGLSPDTSEGVQLDYIVAYNGLTRLNATPSLVDVGVTGTINTDIPESTQLRSTNNDLFKTSNEIRIGNTFRQEFYVTIDNAVDSFSYSLTLSATGLTTRVYTYVATVPADTVETIAADLVAQAVADALNEIATVTDLGNGCIKLVNQGIADSFSVNPPISNARYWNIVQCESIETGKILTTQDTIDTIVTPVSGFDNCNNFETGLFGRETETDSELRTRFKESYQKAGAGTLEAIKTKILNDVDNVAAVNVYGNREDIVDPITLIPAHAFQVIVQGGDDQDIGDKIWEVKPAGIQTWGGGVGTPQNVTVDVTDSNGDIQKIYFSRPVAVPITVKVTLTYNPEEIYPSDGDDQIKALIVDLGNETPPGDDVINQKFVGPIQTNVAGIAYAQIETSRDGGPYQLIKTIISASEVATFALGDISVI